MSPPSRSHHSWWEAFIITVTKSYPTFSLNLMLKGVSCVRVRARDTQTFYFLTSYGSRLVASQVLWNQSPPDGGGRSCPQGLDHNYLLDKSYSGISNLTCHSPRATLPEHKALLSIAGSREEKRAQPSHGTKICRVGVCTGPGLLCSVLKTIQRHMEYQPEWEVPQATTNEGQNHRLFKWPQRYPLDPRVNGDHRSSWLPCLIQPPKRPKSLCGRGV